MDNLSRGGVEIILKSFKPERDIFKVRGIGVAVKVSKCVFAFIDFIFSF